MAVFSDDDFKSLLPKKEKQERIVCEEAAFFRDYMNDRGIKQIFLAGKINFTNQRLSDLFKGKSSKMSKKMRAALMIYFKLSESDLPESIRK